jgi:hypothetical protein
MVMLLRDFRAFMRCMADCKTSAFCVCLNNFQDPFFQCVYFLTVIIITRESLLISLEVKIGSYRYTNGHQFAARKVAGDGSCLFRSLASRPEDDEVEHSTLRKRAMEYLS